MKITHEAILKTLEAASRMLPIVDAPVLPSDIPAWVENLTPAEVLEADEVCDKFAVTQQWPPMADRVRAQVHLRMDAARDVIGDIIRCGRTDIATPELMEDALAFVLIEFWRGKGLDWARFRYEKRPSVESTEADLAEKEYPREQPFGPTSDKAHFPMLSEPADLPCMHLMACGGLVFYAPVDPAAAYSTVSKEGTNWHLYGDTRWPDSAVWVEFDITRIGFPGLCGVLVLQTEIPDEEPEPFEWAARNAPLQQIFPHERSEQVLQRRLEMLRSQAIAAYNGPGPADANPKFVQSYCIYHKHQETRRVAAYTDLLNKDGIPIQRYRMADLHPADVDFCHFALHGLFSLNRARLAGMEFLVAFQILDFDPVHLEPDKKNPGWARFHPSRVLRARPAVRALPTPPNMVDGIMQLEDFQKIVEVRRLEEGMHMLAFDREARQRESMFNDGEATMAAFSHRANGGAVYVLPDRLVEEFDNTDCDEIRMGDVKMPFPNLFISFTPPKSLQLADGAPVDGCYVMKQGDEFLLTLTSHLEGVDYEHSISVTCQDPTFSLHLPTEDPEMCLNAAVEKGIEEFMMRNAPPEEDLSRVIEKPDGTTAYFSDIRAKSRARRIEIFKTQEPVFRACLNIIVNAVCFISFRPEDITDDWEGEAPPAWVLAALNDPSESRRARDRKRDAVRKMSTGDYVRIKVCGKNLFTDLPKEDGATGHGVSPRAHWRRGHWRRQRHGVGLSLITPRWIRPTIVKKDNGPLVETRIYDVDRPPDAPAV